MRTFTLSLTIHLFFLFTGTFAFPSVIQLGCWNVFGVVPSSTISSSTPGGCAKACNIDGFSYGALAGTKCTCTHDYITAGRSNRCITPCRNGSAILQGYLCGLSGTTNSSVYALRGGKFDQKIQGRNRITFEIVATLFNRIRNAQIAKPLL